MTRELLLPNYSYRATVINIVDGDTIDVLLDLGFGISATKRLRFLDIDAYEHRGVERELGLKATVRLTELLDASSRVIVETIMDAEGKYGRVLAYVWIVDENDVPINVNYVLLAEGHATEY